MIANQLNALADRPWLDPTATPEFTNTPGQVAFSPDGSQLIVTTKANGSAIDVFAPEIGHHGASGPCRRPGPALRVPRHSATR